MDVYEGFSTPTSFSGFLAAAMRVNCDIAIMSHTQPPPAVRLYDLGDYLRIVADLKQPPSKVAEHWRASNYCLSQTDSFQLTMSSFDRDAPRDVCTKGNS